MDIFSSKKITESIGKITLFSKELYILKNNLKGAFASIKDDLDMHLDSINQNTNEIQSSNEQLVELELKLEKLADRVDELHLLLNPALAHEHFENIKLNAREQEMFMHLYMVEDRVPMSFLARNACIPIDLCDSLLNNLIRKKIPIIRQLVDNVLYVSLDYNFKDLQARKNILKIDMAVSKVIG